jgi:hypothetical protein
LKRSSTSEGTRVCSLSLWSFTFEVHYKIVENINVRRECRFRNHKDLYCLLISELIEPLTSTLPIEELPPSPLVWILDWGQSIRPVQVVGNPVHPLTSADTNVHFLFSAFLSIGHVLSKLF